MKKTLLETNSSPLKKGRAPKGNLIFQPFVNFREGDTWKTIDKKWLDGNICSGKLAFIFLVGEGGRGGANLDSNQVAKESTRRQEKDLSKTEQPCTISNHTLLMFRNLARPPFWMSASNYLAYLSVGKISSQI